MSRLMELLGKLLNLITGPYSYQNLVCIIKITWGSFTISSDVWAQTRDKYEVNIDTTLVGALMDRIVAGIIVVEGPE